MRTQVYGREESGTGRRRRWVWPVVALVVVALGILLVTQWDRLNGVEGRRGVTVGAPPAGEAAPMPDPSGGSIEPARGPLSVPPPPGQLRPGRGGIPERAPDLRRLPEPTPQPVAPGQPGVPPPQPGTPGQPGASPPGVAPEPGAAP